MSVQAKFLPSHGVPEDDILKQMSEAARNDVRWRDGRVFGLVFDPGDELERFSKKAYTTFFGENGVNPSAFPSLRKFETEAVSMVAGILGGDADVVGNITSGGAESILMAVLAARERGKAKNVRNTRMEVVLPASAHPAFVKAAHYLGVTPVHVAIGKDYRADVKAMRKAVTRHAILMVASAPSHPHGVVDPIGELAEIARQKDLCFHVDACVGGMILPFVRALGYPMPHFDFAVPGVSSMSVDLHKYGYAAQGASVVLYRNPKLRRYQYFAHVDWPGGIYASPTMTGTRPGGAIAAAWAMLNRLGYKGYQEIACEVMGTTRRIRAGIERIDGLHVVGDPHASILAIASESVDIYEVGDRMTEKGWHLDRQQCPPSLHLTVNRGHVKSAGGFLGDLREAVRDSRKEPIERLIDRSKLFAASTVARVLPSRVMTKFTELASEMFGIDDDELPKRNAAMYGMIAAMPNRGDLHKLTIDVLDRMTRPSRGGGEGPVGPR